MVLRNKKKAKLGATCLNYTEKSPSPPRYQKIKYFCETLEYVPRSLTCVCS